ncbi:MAG: hypothetical protein MOGMAGMI_01738 [Candidatus Omnitrophica bacterium]|nr:hypothetical protein [Candidatus Omnitrophota bacterium]
MKPEIRRIIATLDAELERHHRAFFTPYEAAKLLARHGLTTVTPSDHGWTVRNLIKLGHLPHAYQLAGPHSHWVIPHSAARRFLDKPEADYGHAASGVKRRTKKRRK